jgi:hypothetical protein
MKFLVLVLFLLASFISVFFAVFGIAGNILHPATNSQTISIGIVSFVAGTAFVWAAITYMDRNFK